MTMSCALDARARATRAVPRDRSAMGGCRCDARARCCRSVDHQRDAQTPEDQFFSTFLYRDGYRVPSLEKASHFSTETIFSAREHRTAKAWLYHSKARSSSC